MNTHSSYFTFKYFSGMVHVAGCRLRRKRLFNPTQLPEAAAANNSSEIRGEMQYKLFYISYDLENVAVLLCVNL